ncbi:MAG TPA: hypothetical protein VFQ53_32465 [Kofleriaceae bacterium]|nr:hypothetical protein [Kofleriaceae bacterium]
MTRIRCLLWPLAALACLVLWMSSAAADDEDPPPATEEPAAAAPAEHPDHPAEPPAVDAPVGHDDSDGEPATDPFDSDSDGTVSAEEAAERKEFQAEFADVPDDVIVDEAAIEQAHPEDAELTPSMTAEKFRQLVATARKVVLEKMSAKIAAKTDKRMRTFSILVFALSLAGLLLLAMPLFLRKKYPGQGALLFKYSALAAVTFFVTVNLFGGVLYGLRTAQSALSSYTNPSVAIATSTFDALDKNADDFLVMGKELFGPTLEQMAGNPDEQPAVLLLENGQKLFKDVKVFFKIKDLLKSVDFVFTILPIVLMLVTLILFVLAIKPTLVEIVKLPAVAASGNTAAGRDVVGKSLRRVKGELLATICTVGVLAVITLLSSFILGHIVEPAIRSFLEYFTLSIYYLQFVPDASTATVFLSLLGVILLLVLNLAVLILSMTFFLGKCQKIFQARFNDGTPIAVHRRFFQWGIPAVLFVQLFPLLFVYLAGFVLDKVNAMLVGDTLDAEQIPWTKIMLLGPFVLVGMFLVLFWAARGFKGIGFLFKYKVKKPEQLAAGQPIG